MNKFLIAVIILLAGCGPIKTHQANSDIALAKAHWESIALDSQFDVIRDKVPLNWEGKPSFDMLTNTSKPTEIERAAIREFAIKRLETDEMINAAAIKFGDQRVITILNSYHGILNGLVAQLYNQQLTYSEFGKQFYQAINDGNLATQNVSVQNAEAARQAYQSYQMTQQTNNQRQLINNMNKPITCNRVGNYTYCN